MKLATIKIKNKTYKVVASNHAQKRMMQRNIDSYTVVGNILLLGENKIEKLQSTNEEFIIIDKDTNTSTVGAINDNVITIITVIDKSNVFVKKNTKIVNL